jgi:hypothetical protein
MRLHLKLSCRQDLSGILYAATLDKHGDNRTPNKDSYLQSSTDNLYL